jgi:hypothetical protein
MTSVLGRIFGKDEEDAAAPSRGDAAFAQAMHVSDDLLLRIREAERETSAARAIMADVWSQAQNIPFLTTVYEAVQEAKTGPDVFREHFVPVLINGGGRRHMKRPEG